MSNNGINSATNGRSNSSSGGSSSSSGNANINLKTKTATTTAVGSGGGGKGVGAVSGTTSISQRNNDVVGATKTFLNANAKTTTNSKTLPDKITTTSSSTTTTATANHNNDRLNKIATHRRDNSSLGGIQKDSLKFQHLAPQTIFRSTSSTTAISTTTTTTDGEQQISDVGHLVYYDGKIHSGTLDALIRHMVPTYEYYPERDYSFAFLLSARLFIRPHELLAKISDTWEQQQQQSVDVVDDCARYGYGGNAVLMNNVNAVLNINSASPLTQRKNSIVAGVTTTTTATTTNTTNVAELEPKPLQRTATQKSAQNCIRLLSEWIETFPYDFRDERLMQQVRILARKCVYIDNSLGKQVSRILQTLVGRLTALEQYEEFLQTLHASNVDLNPNGGGAGSNSVSVGGGGGGAGGYHNHGFQPLFVTSAAAAYSSSSSNNSSDHVKHAASNQLTNSTSSGSGSATSTPQPDDVYGIMDICASCAHLAHQLTAIELERLSHIGPEEFVQAFAKEYQHSVTTSAGAAGNASHVMSSSLNDMKKTRNLESYVEWFNRLSYLTATEIVKYPKKKQRVRVIEYWIETARECFNIGNFNSLVAIIAGLNLSPIARLKKTWSKVQSAKFSVLEHQMDPTSNFNSYRSTLKAAMWRSEGATDERERIIIPFFSLFVKDLYFLNEGCSNRLPNNHINFEKCSQLAKQVMEFNEWKKVSCPYEKLPNVIAYLQHSAVLNENTLSMASFECEPPENHEEKDRYKTVKAETKQQLLQQLQEQQQQQQHHQ